MFCYAFQGHPILFKFSNKAVHYNYKSIAPTATTTIIIIALPHSNQVRHLLSENLLSDWPCADTVVKNFDKVTDYLSIKWHESRPTTPHIVSAERLSVKWFSTQSCGTCIGSFKSIESRRDGGGKYRRRFFNRVFNQESIIEKWTPTL
jgi:hypothetical protein